MYKIARVAGIVAAAWSFALSGGACVGDADAVSASGTSSASATRSGRSWRCTALTLYPRRPEYIRRRIRPGPSTVRPITARSSSRTGSWRSTSSSSSTLAFQSALRRHRPAVPGTVAPTTNSLALADPLMSHGTFIVASGAHSITGTHILGIPGAAFFIVTVPEPAPLLLIGAGLLDTDRDAAPRLTALSLQRTAARGRPFRFAPPTSRRRLTRRRRACVPRRDELAPVRRVHRGDPLARERDLLRVLAGGEFAAQQAEAQVEQIRVHHVGLAVAADLVELALLRRLRGLRCRPCRACPGNRTAAPSRRGRQTRAAGTSRARPSGRGGACDSGRGSC